MAKSAGIDSIALAQGEMDRLANLKHSILDIYLMALTNSIMHYKVAGISLRFMCLYTSIG